MSKERIYFEEKKYYIACIINIIITIIIWEILPINNNYQELIINMDILFYIILSTLNIYPIIYGGLGSNNKYTIISVIRGINQVISYEINITIIIISIIYLSQTYNIINIINNQIDFTFLNPLVLIFFISLLAESNRIPFDLLEGESEIVGR